MISGRNRKIDNSHSHSREGISWACDFAKLSDSGTLSGTSYEFTGIPATAEMIKIVYRNISLDGTDELCLQLGNRAGYISSGYTGYTRENVTHTAWAADMALLQISSLAAYSHVGEITLTKMDDNIWHIRGDELILSAGTYPALALGYVDVTDYLTSVKLLTNGANSFDAGNASLYYLG